MATFADIKTQFYDLAGGGPEGSNVYFTANQVVRWCNKALQELAEDCLHLDSEEGDDETSATFSVTGFSVWRVEIDDEVVTPISLSALARDVRRWREVVGRPRYWYIDGLAENDDTGGAVRVGLYPTPSVEYSWRAYARDFPVDVSDALDTREMEVPDWAHIGVLHSMLADALSSETRIQNLAAAGVYRGMFEDVKDRLRQRSFSKMPVERPVGSGRVRTVGIWDQLPDDIWEST